jgi:hypothetical protein
MLSGPRNNSVMACAVTVLLLLLGGCAANTEKDSINDSAANAPNIRCPAGYMMICEAKKTGRIRFGRLGKDNLDSCACQPEYGSGRPESPVIPSGN